jgi:hypothetical protein
MALEPEPFVYSEPRSSLGMMEQKIFICLIVKLSRQLKWIEL